MGINMGTVGTVLRDRYEIIAELGRGGMSTVYLAKDRNLGSYWAVKQVKNSTNVDIQAFKKEVELLSSLSHSDIPRIVDRIETNADYFVVMDFIDGVSLGKKVLTEGPQPERSVVEWAKMLCGVLDYLHTAKDQPIVYRDMKPDNVMLTQAGRVKLIDFGIAKECRRGEKQTGASIGTRGYAAPEQYKGASNVLDERTDIYSLGATLYYLVTGLTPGKPPRAMRPIRQINPLLSEGLEYIIEKCTQDAPENRYQNCRELLRDLENIQELNSAYRSKMRRRILGFAASLACCAAALVFVFVGFRGIQAQNEDKFQTAYNAALGSERGGEYSAAAQQYAQAISYKPGEYDTYLRFFNALLPKDEQDTRGQTEAAIDEMRKRYVDNQSSSMYHDPRLMYQLVKRCIEVNDPIYAAFAVDYIKLMKESGEYRSGVLRPDEIDSYGIVASNCAQNIATQDFQAFNQALLDLEASTDKSNLPANEKLDNYYTIMVVYSTYPNNLTDSYTRIAALAAKAKTLIDSNLQSEALTFNNIIPLYQLAAMGLYNSAVTSAQPEEKRSAFTQSLQWFLYLDDLNVDLEESVQLKRANAYKGIFDTYNTVEGRLSIPQEGRENLELALAAYRGILEKNPENFLAQISLTQALLDSELSRPTDQRDFMLVNQNYARVTDLRGRNANLSNVALSQFSSLKQQMKNAGLSA